MNNNEIRAHLLGLAKLFEDVHPMAHLDPEFCRGDQHERVFGHLDQCWGQCLASANIINARYMSDWTGGGPLAVMAKAVRAAALTELRGLWGQLVSGYVENELGAESPNNAAPDN